MANQRLSPDINFEAIDTAAGKIEELVDYLVESMDTDAMEHFVRENLTEYYSNDGGRDDLDEQYAEMKKIKGDD